MKYIIELVGGTQKAIEDIALIDSTEGKVSTPEMVVSVAIDIFLRIRALSSEDQTLIAKIIEGSK